MTEYTFKQYDFFHEKSTFSQYVMGVDIGGTNTNIAIAGVSKKIPKLLYSLHFKTKELSSLIPALNETLNYSKNQLDISISSCCIGGAGVVSREHDMVNLTNVSWDIDAATIKKHTSLTDIYMLNDFQIIGYGINLLNPENPQDLIVIKEGGEEKTNTSTKAVIGGGTGLGKSILAYHNELNAYIPLSSEGGHTDCPIYNNEELELAQYITNKILGIDEPITYEEILSGRGLENIYAYLHQTNTFNETIYTKEIDDADEKAPLISRYQSIDETCKEVFRIYTLFYARCAKNIALDSMATGGIYIAGGIASKNKKIFQTQTSYRRIDVLKRIPIYLIVNYDVSLYGACFAAMIRLGKNKI